MNEMEIIKDYAKRRDAQERHREQNDAMRINMACSRLKALSERANKLMDLANACLTNNIPLGKKKCSGDAFPFTSDGISHKTGFVVSGNPFWDVRTCKEVIGYGGKGGGCATVTIYLDRNGNVYIGHDGYNNVERVVAKINRMCDRFPEFEEEFLEYIHSLK